MLERAGGVPADEAVHVGDEVICDYDGATSAGFSALLLRRPGPEGESAHKEDDEELQGRNVIASLEEVVDWVKAINSANYT